MQFEFATANRILFGPGALQQVGSIAAGMGRRALVLTGWTIDRSRIVTDILAAHDVTAIMQQVSGEPTIDFVKAMTDLARSERCDLVVGFGGGSAIDSAKATAALLTNGGEPLDYLEVIGKGKEITQPSAPWIAIPTTAGTGAEVTRNAVLASPEHHVKVSLRSPYMLPRVALVDPQLTHSLPPAVTASTGMDALAQLIEPFVSIRANPIADAFCREGMVRAARSLRAAYEHGDDAVAREDMAMASLLGGLALANAGLGAVHGFAGPVGGMFPAPHGAVCARLLPPVMSINVTALREREPENVALRRYDEVARILTANPAASAQDGVIWVQELYEFLKIPPLSSYGITEQHLDDLVEKSAVASSMKANPIKLTRDEMREMLELAL
ncbi:MAG: iron-containing alcohol dehydrogenase [Chloroflexi bacterium]|nr:iron-containing alcohol dehydrogenase [Chloroflexota bacterium]MCL5275612.1 iron-containing alcohol dehydrogenase [Chloroflexota bacterium]